MTAIIVIASILAYVFIGSFVGAGLLAYGKRERWYDPGFAATMGGSVWPIGLPLLMAFMIVGFLVPHFLRFFDKLGK